MQWRVSKRAVVIGAALVAAVLAAIFLVNEKPEKLDPPAFSLNYTPCQTGRAAQKDCQDPQDSSCVDGSAKMDLASPTPIFYDNNPKHVAGVLTLEVSGSCQTAWPRVIGVRNRDAVFRMVAVRRGEIPNRASFDFSQGDSDSPVVFGNMVSLRPPGCVYAEAQVQGGPIAHTRCTQR